MAARGALPLEPIELATVLFAPVLAEGSAFGQGEAGAVAPAGVSVAVGAFLFGVHWITQRRDEVQQASQESTGDTGNLSQ